MADADASSTVHALCAEMQSESRVDPQDHALVQAEPRSLPGADLEHVSRPPTARDPPRREAVHDAHDLQVGVAEDDIEGHPHEEHVDRLLAEGQALARGQGAAAEQAARAGREAARETQALEQRPPVGRLHVMPGIHDTHRSASSARQAFSASRE
jgi:hypothetical protein